MRGKGHGGNNFAHRWPLQFVWPPLKAGRRGGCQPGSRWSGALLLQAACSSHQQREHPLPYSHNKVPWAHPKAALTTPPPKQLHTAPHRPHRRKDPPPLHPHRGPPVSWSPSHLQMFTIVNSNHLRLLRLLLRCSSCGSNCGSYPDGSAAATVAATMAAAPVAAKPPWLPLSCSVWPLRQPMAPRQRWNTQRAASGAGCSGAAVQAAAMVCRKIAKVHSCQLKLSAAAVAAAALRQPS